MSYRDEREALLAENAALRRSLADAGGTPARAKTGSRVVWIVAAFSMTCVAGLLWARVRWDQAGDAVRANLQSTRAHGPGTAAPAAAAPLQGFTGTVTRRGTVVRAQRAGVQRGARCWINVTPTTDHPAYNCHVQVECDPGVILYGHPGTGHGQCDVEGGVPVRMMDPFGVAGDRDPALDLDLTAGRVNLDDGRHGLSMSVGIRLD
ncbi:MAG: hypothetical protein U0325_13560 [Polyangiales bacterium]